MIVVALILDSPIPKCKKNKKKTKRFLVTLNVSVMANLQPLIIILIYPNLLIFISQRQKSVSFKFSN